MPIDVDLTGCCRECYMPLRGGVCEYDPEHTPLPQDLSDPNLAEWLPSWLQSYSRRGVWPHIYASFGPLPPVPHCGGLCEEGLAPPHAYVQNVRDLQASVRKHAGVSIWGGRPLCRECEMPLSDGKCPLNPDHCPGLPFFRSPTALPVIGQHALDQASIAASLLHKGTAAGMQHSSEGLQQPAMALVSATSLPGMEQRQSGPGPPSTIEAWLLEMDRQGFLTRYCEAISKLSTSPAEVLAAYSRRSGGESAPCFEESFFEDAGIRKLGHRRLFEKWLVEHADAGA